MHHLYATTESCKIKLGPLFVCKEDIPTLGGQNSPMFWLFHSLHECALSRRETEIRGSAQSTHSTPRPPSYIWGRQRSFS